MSCPVAFSRRSITLINVFLATHSVSPHTPTQSSYNPPGQNVWDTILFPLYHPRTARARLANTKLYLLAFIDHEIRDDLEVICLILLQSLTCVSTRTFLLPASSTLLQRWGQRGKEAVANWSTAAVAQWLERPPHDREVAFEPRPSHAKDLKKNGTYCLLGRRSASKNGEGKLTCGTTSRLAPTGP